MQSKISTIIPVYNSESYLEKCVESVLNQTVSDIECILVDDGSTDRSPIICDEYAKSDARIKVIHQKNARIGAARNAGINIATGQYITFLDSDDFIEANTYEKCLEYMERDGVDIVEWDVQLFYENGLDNNKFNKPFPSEKTVLTLSNWETMYYMYDLKHMDSRFNNIGLITHCVWTKMFRKELFNNNLRFPVGKEYEDEIIVHRLMERANKIVTTNERFSNYRLRSDSTIHTMPLSGRYNKLEALEDRFDMIIAHGDRRLIQLAAKDYLLALLNFYLSAQEDHNDQYKQLCILKIKALKKNRNVLYGILRLIFDIYIAVPELIGNIYSLYRKVK